MKRLLALLLCLVMVFSLIPAAAAEDIEIIDPEALAETPEEEDPISVIDPEKVAEEAAQQPDEPLGSEDSPKTCSLNKYLVNYCTLSLCWGTLTAVSDVQLWSYPCNSNTNTNSKVVVTISKGTSLTINLHVKNSAGHSWYRVIYEADGTSQTLFAYDNSSITVDGSYYLNKLCTRYASYANLTVQKTTTVKTLPCAASTNKLSGNVVTLNQGAKLTATGMYLNNVDHYWYKVSYNGTTGYVFCGDVSTSQRFDCGYINSVTAPKGQRTAGAMTLKGKIYGENMLIVRVDTKVINTDTNATVASGYQNNINAYSYSIQGKDPDTKCKVGNAKDKTVLYAYTITAKFRNYYSTDGETLSNKDENRQLYRSEFWVGSTKPTRYTITYYANDGYNAPAPQTKKNDTAITLSSVVPTRDGYNFLGWATSSSSTTVSYQPGATYNKNANLNLYAVWQLKTYTVSYNANGGSGAPASQTKSYGTNLTLSTITPVRAGYNFLGWATSSGSSTVSYLPGALYTAEANLTLYAVWQVITYSITYDANGGSGAPAAQTKTHNVALTLSSTVPTRDGYKFLGWAASSTATEAQYQPGATYTNNGNAVLYAVWQLLSKPKITASPKSVTANSGDTVTFTVGASGSGLSYTWYYRTSSTGTWRKSKSDGCDTNTLTLTATAARDGYQFYCKVSNAAGKAYSKAGTLTVLYKPVIQASPASVSIVEGNTFTFTVKAKGAETYRWYYRTAPGETWKKSYMTGYNTDTLTVKATAARDGYQWYCRVTNSVGTSYTKAATLTVLLKPTITTQPSSMSISAGGYAAFVVEAENADSFQWQVRLPGSTAWTDCGESGANTSTLLVKASASLDGAEYRCAVSNANGTVYSKAATLTVT